MFGHCWRGVCTLFYPRYSIYIVKHIKKRGRIGEICVLNLLNDAAGSVGLMGLMMTIKNTAVGYQEINGKLMSLSCRAALT